MCRADVNSIYERLYYENVIAELGDSSELLYISVANAALANLPYLIALDHQSRLVPFSAYTLQPFSGFLFGDCHRFLS